MTAIGVKDTQVEQGALLFKDFISTKRILVADPVSGSRAGLAKTIIDMGAKTTNVLTASSFEVAETEIERVQPDVIITDYDLGKRSGLDLLPLMRKHKPDPRQTLFVLVTGNTSQSAVAQAAEEDVDTFTLKPYTIEVLKKTILKAALQKIRPSTYQLKIDEGKSKLFEGHADEAMAIFEAAMKLDPKPALAFFYHGQAEMMKKALDTAQEDFAEGLNYNKIHYKCLTGLYDVLMQQKQFTQAYDVVKRIARYFPANPARLAQVLRLAVMTQSYEDIEKYYQIFIGIDSRNDEMIKYMCASLVVCGKFYLRRSFNNRALELFQKAGATAAGRVKILREIVSSLCEFDLAKDAQEYLKRFPSDTQSGPDYLSMQLLVMSRLHAPELVVDSARKLIASGIEDPVIYEVAIEKSVSCGLKDSAENMVFEASKKWPKEANRFSSLLEIAGSEKEGAEKPSTGT